MQPSARSLLAVGWVVASVALAGATGCSSAKKKTPELSRLEGKKVALISIDGEKTSRSIVEVALVNQLMKRGSFELVGKREVDAARGAASQDTTDWIGVARKAGADYALKANVLQFDAVENEGYSSEKVEDSQMAAERGEDHRMVDRLYKVKSLDGKVRVQLDFAKTDEKDPDLRSGVAEAEQKVTAEGKTGGIHLPPRLRFLETIANEAFQAFFEKYE